MGMGVGLGGPTLLRLRVLLSLICGKSGNVEEGRRPLIRHGQS